MKMGTKAYQFAQICFKDPTLSLEGYNNISQVFNPQEMSDYSMKEESEFQAYRITSEVKKGSFDLSKFLKKCSKLILFGATRDKIYNAVVYVEAYIGGDIANKGTGFVYKMLESMIYISRKLQINNNEKNKNIEEFKNARKNIYKAFIKK